MGQKNMRLCAAIALFDFNCVFVWRFELIHSGGIMTELSCAVLFFFVCGASALHDWSATPIKLAPDDLLANTYFGYSVAIDGEYAVVGAPMLSSTGVAYAFKRSGN